MLTNIISGLLPSALVCIQDHREQSGHGLLRAFIDQAACRKENEIHILCYENSVRRMKNGLKICNDSNMHFHDCFTDHRGWIESTENEMRQSEKNVMDKSMLNFLKLSQDSSGTKCIVIIDSLTPLILHLGFPRCYRELHSLVKSSKYEMIVQCIFLVHEDVLPDADSALSQLEHLATTCIRIEEATHISNGNPVATITHRKPGGKILNEVEYFSIDGENKLTSHNVQSSTKTPLQGNTDTNNESSLPQDLTTFKLSLGHQEKQARSELVLPYVRTSKDKGGKVFYQPDAADDWDEEDPDDDLNI